MCDGPPASQIKMQFLTFAGAAFSGEPAIAWSRKMSSRPSPNIPTKPARNSARRLGPAQFDSRWNLEDMLALPLEIEGGESVWIEWLSGELND